MAPTFPQRKIGETPVSAIGFGAMRLSFPIGNVDDDNALRVLTRAADMGITLWDTSDFYGPFTNEALIGRWFRETGRRDEIFLCTKFGMKVIDGKPGVDGSALYVEEACDASLERLGTTWIDLYYMHRMDSSTPIEVTVSAMKKLKDGGKIRYLGLSECSAKTLRRAHAVHPIAAAEMEYSPFALEIESPQTNFLNTARELGTKIVAYSPLGRGALTGTIKGREELVESKDVRLMFPQFSEENLPHNLSFAEALGLLAKEKGCTPGQLSLAWCLAQGDDIIPIPGTKHVQWLEENAKGVDVDFTREDEKRVRAIIESFGGVKGERYPKAHMKMSFGDTVELENV